MTGLPAHLNFLLPCCIIFLSWRYFFHASVFFNRVITLRGRVPIIFLFVPSDLNIARHTVKNVNACWIRDIKTYWIKEIKWGLKESLRGNILFFFFNSKNYISERWSVLFWNDPHVYLKVMNCRKSEENNIKVMYWASDNELWFEPMGCPQLGPRTGLGLQGSFQ